MASLPFWQPDDVSTMEVDVPSPRSTDKPDPVPLRSGKHTFATAYARRAPTARKPHWEWRMSTHHPVTGERVMRSLGRLPLEDVPGALAEAYREVDPTAVTDDASGVRTIADLLSVWLADMEERGPGGRRHDGDGISIYTLRNAVTSCKHLIRVGADHKLERVAVRELLGMRDSLLEQYAARTVRLDMKVLKQAWTWAEDHGVELPRVAWRRVRVRVVKDQRVNNHRTPTHAEVERVYRSLTRRSKLQLGLYLGWMTGARISELTWACWGDLFEDADGWWIWLDGKTGQRRFPLRAEEAAVILDHRGGAQDDDPIIGGYFAQNGSENLKRACGRVGVEPFTFHGLRRLMTDTCLRRGVELGTYAKLMGHSPQEALRAYREATADDLQGALDLVRPAGEDAGVERLRLVKG